MRGREWKITIFKTLFYWKVFTMNCYLGLRIILTKTYSVIFRVAQLVDQRIFKNVEQQFQLLDRIRDTSVSPADHGVRVLSLLRKLWK